MTLTTEQTTLLRALVLDQAIVREAVEVDTPLNANYDDDNIRLLVTRAENQTNPEIEVADRARALIGTVQEVRPAYTSRRGWMHDGAALRVFGAPLNPAPVNGHHYRIIEGEHKRLVRYNDEAHIGDRLLGHCPWTIIEDNPGVGSWDDNGYSAEDFGLMYVEVNHATAAPTPVDLAAALLGEQHPWANSVGSPTLDSVIPLSDPRLHDAAEAAPGMANVALLNPPIVPGEMYLVFTDTSRPNATIVGLANHEGVLQACGQYTTFGELSVNPYTTVWEAAPERHHVKLASNQPDGVRRPAETERGFVIAQKQALRVEKVKSRDTMLELNRLALEYDWCGEYEAAAKRIGIMPQEAERRTHVPEVPELDADGNELPVGPPPPRMVKYAWDFTVSFGANFEIDSPSSGVDSRVGDDLGIGVETSGMSFSGSGTVSLPTIEVELDLRETTDFGEDAARAQIDNDMVYSAINDELSNGSIEELVSWNVDDSTDVTDEQDWYDEEEYDLSIDL